MTSERSGRRFRHDPVDSVIRQSSGAKEPQRPALFTLAGPFRIDDRRSQRFETVRFGEWHGIPQAAAR